MSIRRKSLLIVAATLAVMIAVLFGAQRVLVDDAFDDFERTNVEFSMQQALSALENELTTLDLGV